MKYSKAIVLFILLTLVITTMISCNSEPIEEVDYKLMSEALREKNAHLERTNATLTRLNVELLAINTKNAERLDRIMAVVEKLFTEVEINGGQIEKKKEEKK